MRRSEALPHDRHELQQIVEPVVEHVPYDRQIDIVIAVNEHVSEPDHVPEDASERCVNPAGAFEQVEELTAGAGLAQATVGHDVRGYVESSLDGDLQGV